METSPNVSLFASNLDSYVDCFNQGLQDNLVSDLKGSVDVLDIKVSADNVSHKRVHCANDTDLSDFLGDINNDNFATRIYFLTQRDSWSPLGISHKMLDKIIKKHQLSSHVLEVLRSFKFRSEQIDDAFCMPLQTWSDGRSIQTSYVYKYAELKSSSNSNYPWVIRQTGFYHIYSLQNVQSIYIMASPKKSSLAETRISNLLTDPIYARHLSESSIFLHLVLVGTYLHFWRDYCSFYEAKVQHYSTQVTLSSLEDDLNLSHGTLLQLRTISRRFLPLAAIFQSLTQLVRNLYSLQKLMVPSEGVVGKQINQCLENFANQISAHSANATYVLQLCDGTQQIISDTLSLKDQYVASKQNENISALTQITARDSKAIKIITLLTLFFLPPSFVATVMSTDFTEQNFEDFYRSKKFWVYLAICIPLTGVTFALWAWKASDHVALWKGWDFRSFCKRMRIRGRMRPECLELTQV